jgi:ABC-type hemin transport system substrate-binding protein
MTIQARTLKQRILRRAEKLGVEVVAKSATDQALTKGTRAVATVANEAEKAAQNVRRQVASGLDKVRAKVHAATAPVPPPKPAKKPAPRTRRG